MKTTFLKRAFLLSALVLASTAFFAQNTFEIRGKIVKSDRFGGNHASVTLLDYNSMEIVATETCNDNGEFLIEDLSKGNYILLVQKPGYAKPERRFISISDKGTAVETADLGLKNTNPTTNGTL
jgi:hypothetical protein